MSNTEWRTSQANFQGYVKAKLEGISELLKAVDTQTDKNTKDIAMLKGWGLAVAGIVGSVGGIVSRWFK